MFFVEATNYFDEHTSSVAKIAAFDLLNKMRYILWAMALLEACDVTSNGRHLGCHLGFYQELEIRLKPREIVNFCALHEK